MSVCVCADTRAQGHGDTRTHGHTDTGNREHAGAGRPLSRVLQAEVPNSSGTPAISGFSHFLPIRDASGYEHLRFSSRKVCFSMVNAK